MSKLDILVAEKVMGWTLEYDRDIELHFYQNPDGSFAMMQAGWSPSKCLDDALLCLERASKLWRCEKWESSYECVCPDAHNPEGWGSAKTAPLAMCLAALRASGVPESLITKAIGSD